MNKSSSGNAVALNELQEFAGFPAKTQRYIRRSLDVAYDSVEAPALWSRDTLEKSAINAQVKIYAKLPILRESVPTVFSFEETEKFLAPLVSLSAFDLGQEGLPTFGSYRFLYERLLGATARPWLPSAFCAAAALPHLRPEKRRELLQSISEAAATAPGWSSNEPLFFPEWVDKE